MFLEPKAYDFAQRILKITMKKTYQKKKTILKKLQIGNTNYQKFEQIAKMIEKNEEIEKKKKNSKNQNIKKNY